MLSPKAIVTRKKDSMIVLACVNKYFLNIWARIDRMMIFLDIVEIRYNFYIQRKNFVYYIRKLQIWLPEKKLKKNVDFARKRSYLLWQLFDWSRKFFILASNNHKSCNFLIAVLIAASFIIWYVVKIIWL